MSDLERVREWIRGFGDVPEEFTIDFTSQVPGSLGLFPGGLVEVERRPNLLGDVTVTNQYNFALYCLLPFSPEVDSQAQANAEWVIGFQRWVQEESIRRRAPTFGNHEPENETMTAQNGALYESGAEGAALYVVLLSAQFKNFYGSDSNG
ncbi:hypothetical protein LJC64_02290 [Ruminococcaceae bacterium OttesenSCG-928-A11]|nr:hypothetical protein [Ruminococcaceae bacterium OttesenSCG-928-A11]